MNHPTPFPSSLIPLPLTEMPALIQRWRSGGNWWQRAAAQACDAGNYRVISARNSKEIYLVRCWLTPPVAGPDQGFESAESVLLHYFVRGDDDQSLHDHPWDFTTTILTGGYWEHLPPADWQFGDAVGPTWNERIEVRAAGMTVNRIADHLHCVGDVLPGTWTLVRTGARKRDWGFHPPGQLWTPWRTFLKIA